MLRAISDMPVGTIGFEAVGEVEDDDWEDAVEPVLRREIAEGRNVRLLYLIGSEAREVEGDAMSADTGFRVRHATSFERVAVVSDEDWIRPALRGLSFRFPARPGASASATWRRQRLGLRRTVPSAEPQCRRAPPWICSARPPVGSIPTARLTRPDRRRGRVNTRPDHRKGATP